MRKHSWIRLVYLYLMTSIGLVVLIIGLVSLLQLGLKMFIFTQADSDYYIEKPIALRFDSSIKQAEAIKTCEDLTETDKQQIQAWLDDYNQRVEQEKNIDRKRSQRERQAAQAVAMVLVGFPLYWVHWSLIKRDRKREEV